MTEGQITISPRAIALFRGIRKPNLAFHIVWAIEENGSNGHWVVGFTPEGDVLSADPKVREWIVAGRYDGFLVVLDGPSHRPASALKIEIDSVDGRTFAVNVA